VQGARPKIVDTLNKMKTDQIKSDQTASKSENRQISMIHLLITWPDRERLVLFCLEHDTLKTYRNQSNSYLHTVHIVQSSSAQKPCLPHQQDIIPYVVKISVLRSLRWVNVCPKHVELILEINKTVFVASSWCSIWLYLHWWCTVKHKSNLPLNISLPRGKIHKKDYVLT
jgi:hypothetical protein